MLALFEELPEPPEPNERAVFRALALTLGGLFVLVGLAALCCLA